MTQLDRLLANAPAEALLPTLRAGEASRVVRPLGVVEVRDLGEGPHGSLRHLLVEDARGVRYGVPAVVTEERVRRAGPGDGAAAALVPGGSSGEERAVPVDQTNELVVVGDDRVVKWYLHPSADDTVALQRQDLLAAAGFTGTPAVVDRIVADDGSLLALVTEFLPSAQDGWEWLVEDVRAMARGESADVVDPVRALGELVARMHVAFAQAGVVRASSDDVRGWLESALADADGAELDPDTDTRVRARLAPLGEATGTSLIPIHGDLHVGQVLRGPGHRYYVIDFDGNPLQPLDVRSAPAPAARDVAGMLASLDHAARVVIHRTADLTEDGRSRVLAWIPRAQRVFLTEYVRILESASLRDLLDDALLVPFMVDQECREYIYAAQYLTHWRYVPDAALPALLSKESL
ncbi:MAG: aminoglycoside phosphotransferase [Actinomycetales bacterium]|nr:aminoglycoside phosphotransferase [Actinomycetales bacterium]